MSASFYDLIKYAKTGISSDGMTDFDQMKAIALCGAGGIPISTITGVPPITFTADGTPLTSWQIVGNMTQTGTPTPDAPIMPQECGDPTPNLCDVSNGNKLTYNASYDNYVIDDDEQTVTTSGNALVGFIVPVDASTTYTVYAKSTEYGMLRIREYSDKPSSWSGAEYIQQSINAETNYAYNFTATSTTKYVVVAFYFESSHSGAEISEIMLNAGGTPLDYVPYGYALDISCGGVTKTIYLREPLRKIGDYADTISSDGTVTRNIVKIDLAELTWGFITSSSYAVFWANYTSQLRENIKGISNAFDVAVVGSFSSLPDLCMRVYEGTASQQRLAIRYDALGGDTSALRAFLKTGAWLWAVLETPTAETVTVPTITPDKGSNTLSIGTVLPPSNVSLTGHIKQ